MVASWETPARSARVLSPCFEVTESVAEPDVVPEAGFACKSNRAMDVVAVLVDSTVNADPAVPSD